MDYQSKQKQVRQQPSEQEIFKAICKFHSSGITTEDFCQMYEIDEVIKPPGRTPLPEHLRGENTIIDPIGIGETDVCIRTEITELPSNWNLLEVFELSLDEFVGVLFLKNYKGRT